VALAADDEVVPHLDDAGAAAEAVVVVLICPFTGVGFGFACVGTGGVNGCARREHRREVGGRRGEDASVITRIADVVERGVRERCIDGRRARVDVLEGQNADLRVELGDPPYRSGATRRIRQRARVLTNADNAFRVRFMR